MCSIRPLASMVLLSTVALTGMQCSSGDGGSSSTTGSSTTGISVQIAGLATNSDGHVTVTGGVVSRFVTRSTTLTGLTPGQYTVTAEQVLTGQAVMAPTPVTQTVTVNAAQITTVTVSYNQLRALALRLQEIIGSGLTAPIFLASPPSDARLFIAERAGRIRIWNGTTLLAQPYLDISNRVSTDGERGLLSFAFHPQYATNGFVFVHYTDLTTGDIVVERLTVSVDPNQVNPVTAQVVIRIAHATFNNHNGGTIAFGPDGFLWISTGDGGGRGDPFQNGQSTASLLGKMLRIDVPGLPYVVPFTNPFGNEVWARGLRNPWRWAFDRDTNQVYIADVGEDRFEEVDVAASNQPGVNYGWSITEGSACFSSTSCDPSGQTLPVLEYDHSMGCSITGGYVYRGPAIPDLQGRYFYSDFCTGFLRSFRFSNGVAMERIDWNIPRPGNVFSFGEDANRELYVIADNRVLRIATQ